MELSCQKSYWIEASAGSGKTTLIVQRVIKLIQAGEDPGKILALTYTNAAAIEMQTRVNKFFDTADTTLPITQQEYLNNPVEFTTIHAWAKKILDQAFAYQFQMGNPLLLNRLLEESWRATLGELKEDWEILLNKYNYQTIHGLLKEANNFQFNWQTEKVFVLAEPPALDSSELYHYWLQQGWDLNLLDDPKFFLTKDLKLRRNLTNLTATAVNSALITRACWFKSIAEYHSQKEILILNQSWLRVAKKTLTIFAEKKLENRLWEYADLIKNIAALNKDPDKGNLLSLQLAYQINHLLVDEAQDINPQQWDLIKIILQDFAPPKTWFIVGDYKQSIFSFQGASPEQTQTNKKFLQQLAAYNNMAFDIITLTQNYRSDKRLITEVDKIIQNIDLGFTYQKPQTVEKLNQGQLIYLTKQPNPLMVAMQITEIISKQFSEIYSDILIIFRKRNPILPYLKQSLNAANIPWWNNSALDITESLLIADLIALMEAALQPLADFFLARFLRSFWVDFPEKELIFLLQNKTSHLFKVFQGHPAIKFLLQQRRELLHQAPIWWLLNLGATRKNEIIANFGTNSWEEFLAFAELIKNYPSASEFCNHFDPQDLTLKLDATVKKGIQLSTIHNAKGQEARIVFWADFEVAYKDADLFFYDPKLPPLIKRKLWQKIEPELWEKNIKRKELENNRLTYVALTRAQEQIFLTSWKKG